MAHTRRTLLAGATLIPAVLLLELALWPRGADGAALIPRFGADYCIRAATYCALRYQWFVVAVASQFWLLYMMASEELSRALERTARELARGPAATAAMVALLWCAATRSLSVAFSFASGYLLDVEYGLTQQSVSGWFGEKLLAQAISASMVIAAMAVVVWLAGRLGRRWWMTAAAVVAVSTVCFVALEPVLVDPLFDRYTPLAQRKNTDSLIRIATSAGFDPARLWVCDASHRTTRTNAFVNGLGPTERITLWDTLLDSTPMEEVELVLSHELGHWKARHTTIGTALAVGGIVLMFALLGWLYPVPGPRDVPAMLLTVYLGMLVTCPVQNAISRTIEAQADWLSLELSHRPEVFIKDEISMSRQNLSEVDPARGFVWFLYTHPPVADRIAMAERWAREKKNEKSEVGSQKSEEKLETKD